MSWLLEGHQTFAAWMTSYLVFQSLGCSTAGGGLRRRPGLATGMQPMLVGDDANGYALYS